MARVKQTARKSVPPGGAPRKQLLYKTIGRNRRFPGRAVRLPSFRAGGEDQSSETEEEEEEEVREWYVGWRGSDRGEREPWDHPEASWEAHHRRRSAMYTVEMSYAFSNWYGTPLIDMADGDGVTYGPRDPDPSGSELEKRWRPHDEISGLLEEVPEPFVAVQGARANFTDFINDDICDKNLNCGRWASTLRRSFATLPECEARGRILWVLEHCLDMHDGSLA